MQSWDDASNNDRAYRGIAEIPLLEEMTLLTSLLKAPRGKKQKQTLLP